jgi:transposase
MLSKEGLIVLHHYLKEGLSKTANAAKLGISRRTVQRYITSGRTEPQYGPREPRASKLDPYHKYLRGRLLAYPELSGARLLQELRELGYTGGYTILKEHLRTLRPKLPPPIEQRFEVEPGHQAQVDFATFKTSFGTVSALLVVLSWSRVLWVRFALHQDQLTLLSGLHQAFLYFGGVPRTLLFDRMRPVVAGSQEDGKAVFNAELLRFAAHYGFQSVACRPYRAKTKGRVERAVSYLRRNFFYGREFRDLEDLNAQCAAWLDNTANARVHGTTRAVPWERLAVERSSLLQLPQEPYIPRITVGRRVGKYGFISYNGNEYSVPQAVGQGEVQVRATLTEVRLFQDDRLVAIHPVLEGRGQRRLVPGHRRPQKTRSSQEGSSVVDAPWGQVEVQRRPLEVYERVLS